MDNKPVGVILAGGKGSRLGGLDKGLIEIHGRKLVEITIANIKPHVNSIVISANRNLDDYRKITADVVPDLLPHYPGPLTGILSAMDYLERQSAQTEAAVDLLILPCDMPRLPSDLTVRLAKTRATAGKRQPVISHDGYRLQPLCCLLPLALKSRLESFIRTGNQRVMDWMRSENMLVADFSDAEASFININTKEELLNLAEA